MPGPYGRFRKVNHFPWVCAATNDVFGISAGADVFTSVIMPAEGWIGRSTMHCSNPGTGTSINVSCIWFDGLSGTGNKLTTAHVDTNGNLIVAANAGDFAADTTRLPSVGLTEGKQIILNSTAGSGTVTAGGSWELALYLIL